jgi:hypothetical protein
MNIEIDVEQFAHDIKTAYFNSAVDTQSLHVSAR